MVELFGIFWLTRLTSRLAVGKGYSKWYAAYVPAMWVATEFMAMFIVMMLAPDTNLYLVMLAGVLGGMVGGSTVYWSMRARPLQGERAQIDAAARTVAPGSKAAVAASPAPASAQANGGQALSGYCEECGENTWLTPEGACEKGHSADSISGVYWALRRD